MLKSQKLTIELSEKRERLNVLLDKSELSDEEKQERESLTKRLIEIEPEIRAAIAAEGVEERTDPGESAELRALVDRANLGGIFEAVIEHRATSGAEKEIQDHFKLAGNQIPLAMLREPETRAVTPAPADVGQQQQPIIPGVFPQACASFLSVDMPTVGVGEPVFPVLTTNADVKTPAENADAAETTGAFSADVLSPARLQASFFYSREDRARFAGMAEALRTNLSDALADALDKQVISGTNGLLASTNLANNNASSADSFASYRKRYVWDAIDGKYASMASDLRILVGAATYGSMAEKWRGNSSDIDALASLMAITGGVKVSAHVPAVASNKQNGVTRRGMRRDMVAPVWEGVALIPDEITLAKKGQINITAVMLHAVKILRADGFRKVQAQHA